jgi:hypothetical protein
MDLDEQAQSDLWSEIKQAWCHRLVEPEFDAKQFKTFVAQRILKEEHE